MLYFSRALFLIVALALGFSAAPAQAATDPAAAVQSATAWLLARQQEDGSFPGFNAGSNADAIFALAAAGIDPNSVLKNGASPVSAFGNVAAAYASGSTAAAGKTILAVVAADKDPRFFGGADLVAQLYSRFDPRQGTFGTNPNDQAFALLALVAAGEIVPVSALNAVQRTQRPDGGWSFDSGDTSDTNTTAMMAQALVASGERGAVVQRALTYLKSQQNADGGFPYSKASPFGSDSDANSTALVIQALAAAGEDPRALTQSGGDPISALLGLQNANGAFRYQAALPDDNDLATAQAIPALLLKPFPLKRAAASAPAPVPAALPNTGGADSQPWLLLSLLAALAIGGGVAVRKVARGQWTMDDGR
jgi:LPXTG-motif cell wall-anchored protein